MIIPSKEYIISKKCNDKTIKRDYPEFYNYILDNFSCEMFSEKLYWFYNDIKQQPVCICGDKLKFLSFKKGYQTHCSSKCANSDKSKIEQIKRTNQRKYNGTGFASKICNDKVKQTKLKKYGNEKYVGIEKRKKTNLERYGVEYGLSSKEIRKKSQHTKLKRYGDENYNNQEKTKQTKLKRYGNENYNNPEKIKKTNIERFGIEYPFQSKEVQNKIKQNNLKKYGSIYPLQNKELLTKSLSIKKSKFIENHNDILDISEDNIYTCKCPHQECTMCIEKQFQIPSQKYHVRKYEGRELCTKLCPGDTNFNTSLEIFIKSLLDKHNIIYETNNRNILNGKELDIYIPSKQIAIECNGVYWHCDQNKEKNYHYNKYIKCKEKCIQLISIWEDQIINNPEKIESIILSKLGIYNERIYARKCSIKEVPSKECNNFLNLYHLQGSTNSSIRLGLYYNDELISVMTFGKGRKCLNSKINYELYRYCCKNGVQVTGGASKLFNWFIKNYNPESIESFSSNDISNGSLYEQLNFDYVSTSIGYWYIDNKYNRYHRYSFRKQELIKEGYDKDKTEFEIMDERGFYRIYDSGQTKWIKKF